MYHPNDAVLSSSTGSHDKPDELRVLSTADNQFNLFLDGSSILSGSNWQTAFSTTLNINPGIHTVQIKGTYTSGAPGALFALTNNGDGSWPLVSDSSWSPVAVNAGVVGVAPWGVPNGWPGGTSAQWIWGSTPSTTTLTNSFTASLLVYQDTMNDSVITDNCTNDENNSKCQLKDETVDGVQTYRNYNPTGLAPLPSCQNFPGPTQVFNVCHNWWIKTRTYICAFGGSYDFSDIKKRAASINNSAIDGGAALTYTDMRKDASGNWVTEGDSIQLTPRDASACQQACKIKRPATDTQAAISGNATQYQASSRSYAVVYAQCKNGSPCPTQAGDIIDIDCQCIDNFAEAATIFRNEYGRKGLDMLIRFFSIIVVLLFWMNSVANGQVVSPPTSTPNVICTQDLNGDGSIDAPNEQANCVPAGSSYLCPISETNCVIQTSAGVCPPTAPLDTATGKCEMPPQCSQGNYDTTNHYCLGSAAP